MSTTLEVKRRGHTEAHNPIRSVPNTKSPISDPRPYSHPQTEPPCWSPSRQAHPWPRILAFANPSAQENPVPCVYRGQSFTPNSGAASQWVLPWLLNLKFQSMLLILPSISIPCFPIFHWFFSKPLAPPDILYLLPTYFVHGLIPLLECNLHKG